MKTFIAASLLLALTSSAFAASKVELQKTCAHGDESACNVLEAYKEGMRDYRAGQCFRARPYSDNTPEGKFWIRGYHARQTKKISRRNDEHCFLGRDR